MRFMISDRSLMVFVSVFVVMGIFTAIAHAADANLNMVFTTTNAGGEYGNAHVHVVWIKDSSGNFVYTSGSTTTDNKRALWANSRASSLKEWWDSNVANRSADVAARTRELHRMLTRHTTLTGIGREKTAPRCRTALIRSISCVPTLTVGSQTINFRIRSRKVPPPGQLARSQRADITMSL